MDDLPADRVFHQFRMKEHTYFPVLDFHSAPGEIIVPGVSGQARISGLPETFPFIPVTAEFRAFSEELNGVRRFSCLVAVDLDSDQSVAGPPEESFIQTHGTGPGAGVPVVLRTDALWVQGIPAPGTQAVIPAKVIERAFPDDRGGRYSDVPEILTLGEGITADVLNSGRKNDFLQIVACGERAESDMSDGRGKDKSPKPG